MNMSSIMKQYKTVGTQGAVEVANPHRLIAMLFTGARDKITLAISALDREDPAAKGEALSKALGIIEYLRASLDPGIDAEFSSQLAELYTYMERRLTEANLQNDKEKLQEVHGLLNEIAEGWNGIPEEYRA
ncbi:flagellar export chaperone FliS [Pseudomonadales bacterium]|jgi:flagellar protein FliS|nr:flagellar export chaperone FliS [Pseudomonadales bacterium]